MISPVWLSVPFGNTSTYQLSTDAVQTKWIKEIRSNNNVNHTYTHSVKRKLQII